MKKLLNLLLFAFVMAGTSIIASGAERGTPDEAVALVKKAIAFYKTNGRERTAEEINNPSGQFVQKDMYVLMALAGTGGILATPANSKLIGKKLTGIKDIDGVSISDLINAVLNNKEGKGWSADYKWPNPVTKQIDKKSAYVERVGDVYFLCGIYK